MTPERYEQIRAIFHEVAELNPSDQDEALQRLCAGEESLRFEVEELLREDFETLQTPGFLQSTFESPPERIGDFQIVGVLGSGGMGVVYRAEQQHPRRLVALKVVSMGFGSEVSARRLAREAELLARLHHPGIAQIFDAGSVEAEGVTRPFFAMELVDGEPITEFAQRHELSVTQRLRLIIELCSAVQHAHEQGVLHRDLKPSNVFVTKDGRIKVLDFGVGRLVEPGTSEFTLQTQTGQLVGTIAYMSPEQATGDPRAVDERSDVYALGVIAYELLTGELPIDVRGKMLHEAARLVREVEPTSLRTLSHTMSADIDTIVRTALAKEKDRRYASAAELGADIERHLNSKPILARPPSTWDQLVKFSRRNRALVSSVAIVFVVLVAALAVTGVLLDRAVAARAAADAERAEAQEILSILTEAMAAANPVENTEDDYTVRALLDDIAASLGTERELRPSAEATVRRVLGDAYIGLGRYEEALVAFERTQELLHVVNGPDDPATLEAETQVAAALLDLGRYDEGHAMLVGLVERSERVVGAEAPQTLDRMHFLGNAAYRIGDFAQARDCFEQVLEARRRNDAYESEENLATIASLALTLQSLGDMEASRHLTEESVALHERQFGAEHPYTLTARSNYGLVLTRMNQPEDAERVLREVLAIRRQNLEPNHPEIGVSLSLLAGALALEERYDEAIEAASEGFAILDGALGREHRYTQTTASRLVTYCEKVGRSEEAAAWRAMAPNSNQ